MSEIATVQHAIVILGFKEVKSLVLGITVFDTIGKTDMDTSIVHEQFWMHSVGSALAGQIICKNGKGTDEQTAFTASLLHDIGKLVLDRFFSQEYGKVLEKARSNGTSMIEAEQDIMGFHHAEVGGWLCERWKFPPSLVSGIKLHHTLQKANAQNLPIASAVHLADVLCKRAGIGNSGDSKDPLIDPIATDHLNLHEDDLTAIVNELHREEEKVISFLQAIQ
jgi:putative nucleotidyltransferase with HDIG domain